MNGFQLHFADMMRRFRTKVEIRFTSIQSHAFFYKRKVKFVLQYKNLCIRITLGKKYSVKRKSREYVDFVEQENEKICIQIQEY